MAAGWLEVGQNAIERLKPIILSASSSNEMQSEVYQGIQEQIQKLRLPQSPQSHQNSSTFLKANLKLTKRQKQTKIHQAATKEWKFF